MQKFVAQSRKGITAFFTGAAAYVGAAIVSGKSLDATLVAEAIGAGVASAILVYLVPNEQPAIVAPRKV